MKVSVLHEYGAWRHYAPLQFLADEAEIELRLNVLNLPRRFGGAIKRRDASSLRQMAGDVKALRRLMTGEGETIVFGLAPHHPDVVLLEQLRARHRLVLFTSWPHWESEEVVHRRGNAGLRRRWLKLLAGLDVVCVTPPVAEALREYGARTTVIPHAVELGEAQRSTPRAMARRFLYVGRMIEAKGVRDLLAVIEGIDDPELRFDFVGSGELDAVVRDAASRDERIRHLGYRTGEGLWAAYAGADVLILPSYKTEGWEELFGITIIEGFASGLPAIATDCVGPSSIVRDGENGWLIAQRDRAALRASIVEAAVDAQGFARRARAAREEAEARYAMEVIAGRWREVLAGRMG